MKYLHNFKQEDEVTLTFDINNLSHTLLNAVRRLIISDVETVAFRTEYGQKSDIEIKKIHLPYIMNF